MKKLIILTSAILAFAACAKTQFSGEQQSISFEPNALSTKALILPNGNTPNQLEFPAEETFNVFAYADDSYASALMNDVNISKQNGVWKSTDGTYLWPNTGTVDFYAYYPGNLTAAFVSNAEPKGLSLTGIDLGSTVGSQKDPLVGTSQNQSASAKPTVSLAFKHIASQIAVTAFDATTAATLQGKIHITRVVFKNVKVSGDYRDGAATTPANIGKGSWSNWGDNTDITLYTGSVLLAVPTQQDPAPYLSTTSTSATITNTSAFVVVPAAIVDGNSGASIDVSYSIDAYQLNGYDYAATAEQTVNIPLYSRVSDNQFKNGKRYIFNIGISLDGANNEITFSPLVEGWDTENVPAVTIDAVNAALL